MSSAENNYISSFHFQRKDGFCRAMDENERKQTADLHIAIRLIYNFFMGKGKVLENGKVRGKAGGGRMN